MVVYCVLVSTTSSADQTEALFTTVNRVLYYFVVYTL